MSEQSHDTRLDKALRQFDAITVAVQEERGLALEDRRFAFIAGAQWEGLWGEQFANVPMVEINKTAAGLDKIINDYRANRLTVNFRPTDERASEETADFLDGLFRADAYRSKAQQALDNAFEEGAAGGYGAWRLVNEYEDEFDPDDDRQRIATVPIVDADQSVFWDMSSKQYDKSDAKFCFILSTMTRGAFEDEYPDANCSEWPQNLFKAHYDWYTPDIVRIAEYYEVEILKEKRRIFTNAITGEEQRFWNSEIDEEAAADLIAQGWTEEPHRIIKRRRVSKTTFSGANILEAKRYIAGDQIPVVPFYGQRRFIDNMERAQGHVRKAKDPQRVYNAQISHLTETAATSPVERPIFDPEQMAGGLGDQWAVANVERHTYSLARALRNEDGSIAMAGPIGMVTPPQVQPAMAALIQITAGDIEQLTNAADGADQAMSNLSADAMDIAATRTDAKSAIYMDNMKLSVQRWGEIYQSMAPDVYVEEGRKVEKLDDDGESSEAVLMEPFTDEQENFSLRNDLKVGRYKVVSDVTEATVTRRDKTSKNCMNAAGIVAAFNPDLANALVGTALLNMDGEGVDGVQDYVRQLGIQGGWVKPNEEEKKAMAEQQANAQPDATQEALAAQAQDFQAKAALNLKKVEEVDSTIALNDAKRVETLASAAQKGADVDKTVHETEVAKANPQPANDDGGMSPFPKSKPNEQQFG